MNSANPLALNTSPLWGGRRAKRGGWGVILDAHKAPPLSPPHKGEGNAVAPPRFTRPLADRGRRPSFHIHIVKEQSFAVPAGRMTLVVAGFASFSSPRERG
jgi:hypothetical protein